MFFEGVEEGHFLLSSQIRKVDTQLDISESPAYSVGTSSHPFAGMIETELFKLLSLQVFLDFSVDRNTSNAFSEPKHQQSAGLLRIDREALDIGADETIWISA